jgi:hypothetical protein
MTEHENTERDDRQERYQRRRSHAHKNVQDDTTHRRREPYKREQVDYDDLQEEDEWFEHNN